MIKFIFVLFFVLMSFNVVFAQEEKLCGRGTIIVDGICQPDYSDDELEYIVHKDCLIATASYSSELAPQVQMLREIRDNTLLNTESGKIFMNSF